MSVENENVIVEPVIEPKEEYVPKKAYEETAKDLHKYKKLAKEAEARLAQVEAEKAIAEQAEMEAQGKYKELYHKSEEEKLELLKREKAKAEEAIDSFIDTNITTLIGGWKNSTYVRFINRDNVERGEDGYPLKESLQKEADRIKQEMPELIAVSTNSQMPSGAPKDINFDSKDISKMTQRELDQLLEASIRGEKK